MQWSHTDYYNTISWDPSPSPNIIEYDIFRNGILFTRVGPKTFEAFEHSVDPNEDTVTYGVAAVDSQLTQSEIVYVNFP